MVFSDAYIKCKSKLLMLSAACLFIGIAEALPRKLSLIGLDLSAKPDVLGWFLLAVTCYFLVVAVVLGSLNLVRYYLPTLILNKGSSVTSSVLGFTEKEFDEEYRLHTHHLDEAEIGTRHSELQDIYRQRKEIENTYKSRYLKISSVVKIVFELIFPLVFSVISVFVLAKFLWFGFTVST